MATTRVTRLAPVLALLATIEAHAATFVVNSTIDAVDATPGDAVCETTTGGGTCTLRAAILEANALAGADIVSLPAGTYVIATGVGGGDTPAIADFDITDDLQITGAGSATTIIEGNWAVPDEEQDRAFQIVTGVGVAISGVTIVRANPYYAPGGAIANAGTLELSDCVVRDCGAFSYPLSIPGGGIYNTNTGTLTIRRCEIAENITWGDGGGIANEGTLLVEDSLLRDNTGASGGGIANSGTLTVRNSTLAANRARGTFNSSLQGGEGAGAGIFDAGGSTTLEHATISGNIVGPGGVIPISQTPNYYGTGAGLGESNAMATSGISLRSSIVAGNVHQYGGADNDCGTPAPTSLGHNIDGDGTCMLTGTGDLPATNPLLGPLADNGGPTWTMALPAGSPAIDAADPGACLAADQRGAARPAGDCDMGAYENNLPCGDGDVDAGEQCDDGDPGPGDCCSFLCQYKPANTACDVEGDPCTDDRCDGAGVCSLSATIDCDLCETCSNNQCVPGPRVFCRDPVVDGRSSLILEPDRLVWRWTKGEATSAGDFGDPSGGDDYGVCLFDYYPYDFDDHYWRLRLEAQLPGGATCGDSPCWKGLGQPPGSRGSRYRDRQQTQAGIASVLLRPGLDGQSRIIVKGKGPGLGLDPLAFYEPLRMQLQRRNGPCWEAHFTHYDKFRYPDFYKFESAPPP
jgi:CSLREA domain-containing protein